MKIAPWNAAILAGFALAAGAAFAHDDATLDKTPAPHGGQLRMAGPYHFELVVAKDAKASADSPLLVYVTDHSGQQKFATAGASGTATILSGKQKATLALSPDGDNRMKGMGKYAADPAMKVIVGITLAGKQAEQARFTPLAKTGER
jgi:hypothetical protein